MVPRYWTQTNPPYEVDFLIQRENDIFPIEVKSEANTTSKSLKKYKELFPDKVRLRIRFSMDNLKLDGDIHRDEIPFWKSWTKSTRKMIPLKTYSIFL